MEKETATHSSTLAWKIPWMEEPRRLQSMGSQRVGHIGVTSLSLFVWSMVLLKIYPGQETIVRTMVFPVVMYSFSRIWELDHKEGWALKNRCFWIVVLKKTLDSPLNCKEIQPVHHKGDHSWVFIAKDWCWSWNSNTLATWCEDLTHLKRPWCWERLRARREGDDRGWDGWMASPTQWTWVWVDSGSWWWIGRPGMLWFMASQRVGHDWATELNWSMKMGRIHFHSLLKEKIYSTSLGGHFVISSKSKGIHYFPGTPSLGRDL